MSAIAAIVDATRPDDPRQISAVLGRMRDRCPDGSDWWVDRAASLGHGRLRTTLEDAATTQPLGDAEAGVWISADVRLDNRSALCSTLRVAPTLADAEIVLQAYRRWGEGCVDRLDGAFAFAIWDRQREKLFCARDHVGVKPLSYHASGGRVAIASVPDALLAISWVPSAINDGRIADAIVGDLESIDHTSTYYESVSRLPPAHVLVATPAGVCTRRYWQLEPEHNEIADDLDDAHAKQFLAVLHLAVEARLRSADPAGVSLSGGIDSASIADISRALMADDRRALPTFSAISLGDDRCSESECITMSQSLPGLDPHTLDRAGLEDFFEQLHAASWTRSDPFDSHMSLFRATCLLARRNGTNVLLDGIEADVVLAPFMPVVRLLREGRIRMALAETMGTARAEGSAPGLVAARAVYQSVVPYGVRRRRALRQGRSSATRGTKRFIRADFAEQVNVADRIHSARAWVPEGPPSADNARAWRVALVSHPHVAAALERYDRVAASAGVEARHPFVDRRMQEYCTGLPSRQLSRDGRPKHVLVQAMAERLPGHVLHRPRRPHLGWQYTEWIHRHDSSKISRILLGDVGGIGRFVDVAEVLAHGDLEERVHIAVLAQWLASPPR